MALAAEPLTLNPGYLTESTYIPADSIPEVAAARLLARREAYDIIEQNRQHLRDGDFKAVSIPVDALGTASKVVLAQQTFGETSLEALECFEGLVLDSERLLGEAARKNTYEYFKPLEQIRDTELGNYYSHGQSISTMTKKGLTPVAEAEEVDRRINEHVEEATLEAIGNLALKSTTKVRTISECTDWAIDAYGKNSKAGHGGYVPEIEKLMVRDVRFDPITHHRYEEQIGLPGIYINHEVITEALKRKGLSKDGVTKTELHGTQILVSDDIIDFVADLDEVASQVHGVDIYLGEILPEGQPKQYNKVREQAERRRVELMPKPRQLAKFIMGLVMEGTDGWAALGLVEAKVKEILFCVIEQDPSQAAIIFDTETANGIQEVAHLRSQGLLEEAQTRLVEVKAQAPAPGYCGAGSCGLEAMGQNSEEAKKMKEMGLDTSGALIDKERKCKDCGKKDVVYDLRNNKKACLSCKATAKF